MLDSTINVNICKINTGFKIAVSLLIMILLFYLKLDNVYAEGRYQLDTPDKPVWSGSVLTWDSVQHAEYYDIEMQMQEDPNCTYNYGGSNGTSKDEYNNLLSISDSLGMSMLHVKARVRARSENIQLYSDSDFSEWSEYYEFNKQISDSYTIEYHLDGGINSSSNPDKYSKDNIPKINDPIKEGYMFYGWYLDEEYNIKFNSITPEMKDIILYACWVKLPKVDSVSLSITEGSIGLNYYIEIPENNINIIPTIDGNKVSYKRQEDGTYKITVPYVPRKIDDITILYFITDDSARMNIPLINSNTNDGGVAYSVKEYLDKMKNEQGELGELINSTIVYCNNAKCYFGGGAAKDMIVTPEMDVEDFSKKVEIGIDDVKYIGSSLLLKDKISIRHYIKSNRELQFFVNGNPLSVTYNNGIYSVDIIGISASDFDKYHKVEIVSDNQKAFITYNVFCYLRDAQIYSLDNKLNELVKSLYHYHESTVRCINSKQ